MKTDARFPLTRHVFTPHFTGGEDFSLSIYDGGFTPSMLRSAYDFDETITGRGIKIAIVSALDNVGIKENMKVFCHAFSLPEAKMEVFYPFGRSGSTSSGWLTESSLDSQWAHVFAPESELYVVFSRDADVKNMMECARFSSQELGADIVLLSFGSDESLVDKQLSLFFEESQSVFVSSSGDVGSHVSFPSTNPFCISVGGTTLILDKRNYSRIDERAWQNSGGGASEIFPIQPWQGRFYDIYGLSNGFRATPDVSMSADMKNGAYVYVSALGGWTTVGGTSFAASCFAGVCALIKSRHSEIKNSADMLYYLYAKAGNVGYSVPQYYFNDIVTGNSGIYFAQPGWDFATGLGSAKIRQLLL